MAAVTNPRGSESDAPSSAGPTGVEIELVVDGEQVSVLDDGMTLLDALRDHLGLTSVKDGCAPQGQCGCCTVLVDGAPRVACVTPLRRVRGREVTTVDGLADAERWANRFCETGASQCGFCTPGIIVRLAALEAKQPDADHDAVERSLLAHVCRCTGWRTILDAWDHDGSVSERDLDAATARATLESGGHQQVAPAISLGRAPFADDLAPRDTPVAIRTPDGEWVTAETTTAARAPTGFCTPPAHSCRPTDRRSPKARVPVR